MCLGAHIETPDWLSRTIKLCTCFIVMKNKRTRCMLSSLSHAYHTYAAESFAACQLCFNHLQASSIVLVVIKVQRHFYRHMRAKSLTHSLASSLTHLCAHLQLSFSCIAYQCVLLQYFGQTAYIIANPQDVSSAFWSAVPDLVFWPLLVIGTMAAIVASQVRLSSLCKGDTQA